MTADQAELCWLIEREIRLKTYLLIGLTQQNEWCPRNVEIKTRMVNLLCEIEALNQQLKSIEGPAACVPPIGQSILDAPRSNALN